MEKPKPLNNPNPMKTGNCPNPTGVDRAGTCALCQEEKDLQESHILSKFLWRGSGITGDKRKFSVMHWYQFVTSHPPENDIQQILLQPSGRWVLFREEIENIPELRIQVELF